VPTHGVPPLFKALVSACSRPALSRPRDLGVARVDGVAQRQLVAEAAVAEPEEAAAKLRVETGHLDGLEIDGEGRTRAHSLRGTTRGQ